MSEEVKIREILPKDFVTVLKIYNEVVVDSNAIYEEMPRTLEQQSQWIKARGASNFPIVVAEMQGQVVGFGSFGPFRSQHCYLSTVEHSLHVTASHRGLGIGAQLLSYLVKTAKQRHLHAMIAGIDSANIASIRLHERFGFKIVGNLPQVATKFSKRLDLTLMQLLLDDGQAASMNAPSDMRHFSGAYWETKVGYCRAIKRNNFIAISGTTSIKDNKIFEAKNPYLQAKRCLEIIQESLATFGADEKSIVRTRMFVTNIADWPEIGRAHQEFFRDFPPATSMVQISGLIDPDLVVEIEADAILK